jgi:flagellar basal body-associated protein FliL
MAEEPGGIEDAPKKGFPKKLVGIVLGIALLQGGAFFAVFKMAGSSPEPAHGEDSHVIEGPVDPSPQWVEVALVRSFKVPNNKSGRIVIYDIDLSVVVSAEHHEKLKQIAEAHAGEIQDQVARIIRGATDQMLQEDDLELLRSQLYEGLVEIVRESELIDRVLIPRFVPIPS